MEGAMRRSKKLRLSYCQEVRARGRGSAELELPPSTHIYAFLPLPSTQNRDISSPRPPPVLSSCQPFPSTLRKNSHCKTDCIPNGSTNRRHIAAIRCQMEREELSGHRLEGGRFLAMFRNGGWSADSIWGNSQRRNSSLSCSLVEEG